MSKTTLDVSIVLERRILANRWVAEQWEAIGVLPSPEAGQLPPRRLRKSAGRERWLYSGQRIELFTDEAENYLLNLHGSQPRVFVMWRRDEGDELPRIGAITVSFGEAARMLDSGEQVDGVAMPAGIRDWVDGFARAHYRPEVRRKERRYASVRGGGAHHG